MKKLLLTKLFCLILMVSFAEGYQVNLQSAKQSGMGHTGVALRLGAESMHFNPAGMAFMTSKFSFSAGLSGIFSTISYENLAGKSVDTDNSMSTPAFFYAAYKATDDLAFGLAFTTPYGSSLKWGDNWAGAHMVQDISLKAYYFQPTVSYKIADNLSIGAGMMIMAGSFDLNKGLTPVGALAAMNPALSKYADVVPGAVNLKGDAEIAYGFNVGILYDFNDALSFGLSYRSKMSAEVEKGEVKTSYYDAMTKGALFSNPQFAAVDGLMNASTFTASLPMPANTTFGVAYKASEKLTLTADLQFVQWSEYEDLQFDFTQAPDVTVDKDYDDTFVYRIGAEYVANDMFTFRAGAYYDETPVNKLKYNPETPGMNKLGLTMGSTITLMKGLNVDLALTYINGADIEATVKDPNMFNPDNSFAGTYSSVAFIPSVGISYNF